MCIHWYVCNTFHSAMDMYINDWCTKYLHPSLAILANSTCFGLQNPSELPGHCHHRCCLLLTTMPSGFFLFLLEPSRSTRINHGKPFRNIINYVCSSSPAIVNHCILPGTNQINNHIITFSISAKTQLTNIRVTCLVISSRCGVSTARRCSVSRCCAGRGDPRVSWRRPRMGQRRTAWIMSFGQSHRWA